MRNVKSGVFLGSQNVEHYGTAWLKDSRARAEVYTFVRSSYFPLPVCFTRSSVKVGAGVERGRCV